jgi:hypothetical protein
VCLRLAAPVEPRGGFGRSRGAIQQRSRVALNGPPRAKKKKKTEFFLGLALGGGQTTPMATGG